MVTGVTPEKLSQFYPRLYHMAHRDSWAGIKRHGLLCTEGLLDLCCVPTQRRPAILSMQRTRSHEFKCPDGCKVVIRDQKPLIRSRLEPKLKGCTFQQWLDMLNSRVFFWLTTDRLRTLMCAREYCSDPHVVVVVDTLRLAKDLEHRITLAPMNTGNTRPIAHPRSLQTFSRMTDYPFAERLKKRQELVVELAVEAGVPDIMKYVVEVAEMRCSTCDRKKAQTLCTVRVLHP